MILLLTGQSGAGKTTIARALQRQIRGTAVLDGDELRTGINTDLSFSDDDIMENMRRVGEIAQLFERNGHPLVVVSVIAPLLEGRRLLRNRYHVREILILQEKCNERDVKGLYQAGTNFRRYERSDEEAHSIIHITGQGPDEVARGLLSMHLPERMHSI